MHCIIFIVFYTLYYMHCILCIVLFIVLYIVLLKLVTNSLLTNRLTDRPTLSGIELLSQLKIGQRFFEFIKNSPMAPSQNNKLPLIYFMNWWPSIFIFVFTNVCIWYYMYLKWQRILFAKKLNVCKMAINMNNVSRGYTYQGCWPTSIHFYSLMP